MKRRNGNKTDLVASLIAIVIIISAWFWGNSAKERNLLPHLHKIAGKSTTLIPGNGDSWVMTDSLSGKISGYLSVGEGFGYGGPILCAVTADSSGTISGVEIIDNAETVSFISKVERKGFLRQFKGNKVNSDLSLNGIIDAVAGATLTSAGIAKAVEAASKNIASSELNLEVLPEKKASFIFEYRDIAWLLLLVIAWGSGKLRTRNNKAIRWAVMITALFVLGFQLNAQLSISQVNKALIGAWPHGWTQLYFYIMLGGLLILTLATGKNHYCERICPFGTMQEIIGNVGGAKFKLGPRIHDVLQWLQRVLALSVIVVALVTRKPGAANYEVFSAMFNLTGNMIQFGLLLFISLTSLFIKRPWCSYLCPVRPVNDLVKGTSSMIRVGREL